MFQKEIHVSCIKNCGKIRIKAKEAWLRPRGTSLIGNSVRDFSEQKDLQGFLMDFS